MNPTTPIKPIMPMKKARPFAALPAFVFALTLGGFHAAVFAQDRAHFEEATAQRCVRDHRADPVNAERTDEALKAYCGCFAAEMSVHTPTDILNTSRSAATPDQVMRLQLLSKQAAQKCGDKQP